MALVGFHIAIGIINLVAFSTLMYLSTRVDPPDKFGLFLNGGFFVINFSYAGYILSKLT